MYPRQFMFDLDVLDFGNIRTYKKTYAQLSYQL